ncbi:MAG: DUF2723 domain-containing protein [bacterium]
MRKKSGGQKKRKWKVHLKIPKFLIPRDEPIVPKVFNLIDYAGGIVVFFICWAVYLHTLTPTIGFHDSGDMVTAAYVLGIPHPTGYPLYCLLGKLWMTILPIGNIAYRMNLASALCASLACMMVYFIILKVGSMKCEVRSEENKLILHLSFLIPAIVGALMLAFATTFWEQAVIAEKYTLNALFATLLIFILLKWAEVGSTEQKNQKSKIKNQKYLYLFAFTLGLSFTHHMQTIYLVPASIFFVIVVSWKKWRQENPTRKPYLWVLSIDYSLLIKLFCLFILPVFLYLYLPIRASTHPVYNWGDPSTFERLIAHLTAEEYRERYFASTQLLQRLVKHTITFFPLQFSSYFVIISLMGLTFCLSRQRLFFIFLSLICSANAFYSIHYTILNIKDYYIPSYMIMSIWIGYGFIEISKLVVKLLPNYIYSLYVVIIILCPVFLFKSHYFQNDKHKYYFAYDCGMNIMAPLESKSIIFLKGDAVLFPYCYLQYIERKRQDLISIFSYLDKDWYIEEIKRKYPKLSVSEIKSPSTNEQLYQIKASEIITQNIDTYPIYALMDEFIPQGFSKIPAGIFYRVIRSKDEQTFISHINEVRFNLRGIHDKEIYQQDWSAKDDVILNYANSYNNLGLLYLQKGEFLLAIREFKKAIKVNPNDALIHTNLAKAYLQINNIERGVIEFQKASKLNPNNITLHNYLGSLYAQKGRYKEAIRELKQVIKMDINNIKAHQNLACVYYSQGKYSEAEKECNLILKINPENTYIKQMFQTISIKIEGGDKNG